MCLTVLTRYLLICLMIQIASANIPALLKMPLFKLTKISIYICNEFVKVRMCKNQLF